MKFDSVLFLCVANSVRSQMAEGLARKRFGDAVLRLKDPGGNLVEVYARLTDAELAEMPADREPVFLAGA